MSTQEEERDQHVSRTAASVLCLSQRRMHSDTLVLNDCGDHSHWSGSAQSPVHNQCS